MSNKGMDRRQFVGTAALAAAGLIGAASDRAPAQPKPPTGKPGIKVGLYSITFLGVWYQGKPLTLEQMVRDPEPARIATRLNEARSRSPLTTDHCL